MYRKILVAVDNTKADDSLLPHISRLAKMLDSKILLVHVADGWAARNFEQLQLTESEEMKADKAYLEKVAARLREQGLQVTCLDRKGAAWLGCPVACRLCDRFRGNCFVTRSAGIESPGGASAAR